MSHLPSLLRDGLASSLDARGSFGRSRKTRSSRHDAKSAKLMTVLAHDLRNYLSPINGRLHLLQLRAQRDSRQDDVRDSEMGLNGVKQLNRLISDILDVARLDQGMFDID